MIATQETDVAPRDPSTLVRRQMKYRPWRVTFWDRLSGICDWLPSAERHTTVLGVIEALLRDSAPSAPPPRVLFIIGGNESLPPDTETMDAMILDGWHITRYTNVSEREDVRRLDIEYQRGGVTISLKTAADWFGPTLPLHLCRRAWDRLKIDLAKRFDPFATPISTPGRTGLDLLERSLPFGKEYPLLDAELSEYVYANCGQGRIETIGPPRQLAKMLSLDGRWMYSSCLSHLPCGRLSHDTLPYVPERTPGFLIASLRVPDTWEHIGLLPINRPGGGKAYINEPGAWMHGFFTAAEVDLANRRGWHTHVDERWIWQSLDSDPAATWRNKLVTLRHDYERAAYRGDVVAKALADTVRNIMLYAIGRMFARESYDYGACHRDQWGVVSAAHPEIDDGYEYRGDIVHYKIPRPLRMERWARPEWAAQIWGRSRRRLALAAEQIPYARIVALRTDAIWTDGYNPGWLDTGENGAFRAKEWIPGPMSAPQSDTDMRRLLVNARRV